MTDPITARVEDPLSAVTRKNRVGLLTSSLIAFLLVQVGLIPTKINVFGADLDNWDDVGLVKMNLIVSAYFLLSFTVSAFSDYVAYRMKVFSADTEDDREYEEFLERQANDEATEQDAILEFRHKTHRWIFQASKPLASVRVLVEFIFPIVIGAYALRIMIGYVMN